MSVSDSISEITDAVLTSTIIKTGSMSPVDTDRLVIVRDSAKYSRGFVPEGH